MKKKLNYVIFPLLFIVITHLLFTYVNAEWNFTKWDIFTRGTEAFMLLFSIVIGIIFVKDVIHKEN